MCEHRNSRLLPAHARVTAKSARVPQVSRSGGVISKTANGCTDDSCPALEAHRGIPFKARAAQYEEPVCSTSTEPGRPARGTRDSSLHEAAFRAR
jgi:hypothetical protein